MWILVEIGGRLKCLTIYSNHHHIIFYSSVTILIDRYYTGFLGRHDLSVIFEVVRFLNFELEVVLEISLLVAKF